ncbi:MAG: tail fiber protein [Pseudomonadota bacterium]
MSMRTKFLLTGAIAASVAGMGVSAPVQAQDKYLGEIFQVGFNFCPRASAQAAGQILAINSNQSLYSLFGTTYGGDGRTTFGLPDLRGRVPFAYGQQPGLASYNWGQKTGLEVVTLTEGQIPAHSHTATLRGESQTVADTLNPTGNTLARASANIYSNNSPPSAASALNAGSIAVNNTGGGQAHENRMPSLATNFCVQTVGIFPPRN